MLARSYCFDIGATAALPASLRSLPRICPWSSGSMRTSMHFRQRALNAPSRRHLPGPLTLVKHVHVSKSTHPVDLYAISEHDERPKASRANLSSFLRERTASLSGLPLRSRSAGCPAAAEIAPSGRRSPQYRAAHGGGRADSKGPALP